jgi:protein-disulfide isomerase
MIGFRANEGQMEDGVPDHEPHKAHSRRRTLILLGAASAGAFATLRGASWLLDRYAGELEFIPLDDPPGFRRLSLVGATTGAFDPLAGIPTPGDAVASGFTAANEDLCPALFGEASLAAGVVPVAFFSDFNCPNCETMYDQLLTMEAEAPHRLRVRRHEWPILGPSSEISARAAIAAGRQGDRRAFNRRLQRTVFAPSEAYLRDLAEAADLDPDRFFQDMNSDATTQELMASAALSRRFGFPGTPGLVVGRTVVIGQIGQATLNALVDAESKIGLPTGCRPAAP